MNIDNFIKDGKLLIPEEEIDNIYIWTRVTKTQEVLLSSENYFKLVNKSFEDDTKRITNVLKAKMPSINDNSYRFADFLTFMINRHILFNQGTCFAYSASPIVLDSLACYIAHTKNMYLPKEESLADLIIEKVSDPRRIADFLDTDFVLLNVYNTLPEHKYRSAVLDTLLSKRSKDGLCTLIYLMHENFLFGEDLIQKERATRCRMTNLNGLTKKFLQRRECTYKQLMPEWCSLMTEQQRQLLVYSNEQPKEDKRIVNRYE